MGCCRHMSESIPNVVSVVELLERKKKETVERDLAEFGRFLDGVLKEVFSSFREKPSVRNMRQFKQADEMLMMVKDDIHQKLVQAFVRTSQSTLMRDRVLKLLDLFPKYFGDTYQFANKDQVVECLTSVIRQRLDQYYPEVQGGSLHTLPTSKNETV